MTSPIAGKANQPALVASIEALERVMKSALGVNAIVGWNRIVNALGPASVVESRQNDLLIAGGDGESLDDL